MSMESVVTVILLPLIGLGVTFVTARYGKKGDRENTLIDQLQEERGVNRDRIEKLETELQELRITVVHLVSRDAQWRIHTARLAQQVTDHGGQPLTLPPELAAPARSGGHD